MAFANVHQERPPRTAGAFPSDPKPIDPRELYAIRKRLESAIDALAALPPADEIARAVEGTDDASAFAGRVDEALVWLTAFAWELRTRDR